jgi:hypothetical protein
MQPNIGPRKPDSEPDAGTTQKSYRRTLGVFLGVLARRRRLQPNSFESLGEVTSTPAASTNLRQPLAALAASVGRPRHRERHA